MRPPLSPSPSRFKLRTGPSASGHIVQTLKLDCEPSYRKGDADSFLGGYRHRSGNACQYHPAPQLHLLGSVGVKPIRGRVCHMGGGPVDRRPLNSSSSPSGLYIIPLNFTATHSPSSALTLKVHPSIHFGDLSALLVMGDRSSAASDTQFVCTICSKSFGRAEHRKRHELTHASAKPFQCVKCTKQFVRK
jgi:hypothetical protein